MIKDDKGLPGIRGASAGQTLLDSMKEQIFELQSENEVLKMDNKKIYLLTIIDESYEHTVDIKVAGIFSSRLLADKFFSDKFSDTSFKPTITEMTIDNSVNDNEYPYVYYFE